MGLQSSKQQKNTKSLALLGFAIAVIVASFTVGVVGGIFGGILVGNDAPGKYAGTAISGAISSKEDGNITSATTDEENIAEIAKRVSPSVVSIVATHTVASVLYGNYEEGGAGTGVIISKDGYILTNNHVVEGASDVSVVLHDGTSYKAVRVVGRDPLNDIAYLKVPGVTDLTPAVLGDSKTIRIGQRVVAIGNALGQYQNSVTSGIVSGTGRVVLAGDEDGSVSSTEQLNDLIQTDAAINPGNSGGPLVNMAGQVIGINTAVADDADNVGFVIPISATKGTIRTLLQKGVVQRPYLGVQYVTITPEVVQYYKLAVRKGAYIYASRGDAVAAGSPADTAGLRSKDIILTVNGAEVGVAGDVSTLLGEYIAGEDVELGILRDGKKQTLTVRIGTYKQ